MNEQPGVGAGRVEAVSRAARILKAFDMENQMLSVRGMADRTGISRSVCHSIATTLVAEGMLELRPGGGYQLGQALAPIGSMVLERTGLMELAIPSMESLSWRLGGEVHLAYGSGDTLIYLARVRRDRKVQMPNRYGEPISLHRTGAGLAILSALEEPDQQRILSLVSEGRRTALHKEIHQAQERGYVIHQNYELGICSVASPIRMGENVFAAVTVAQPRPLMDDRRILDTGRLVAQVAQAIEKHYRLAEV